MDERSTLEPESVNQSAAEEAAGEGSKVIGDGNGDVVQEQEAEDEIDRRAPMEIPRAPVTSGAVGPVVEPLDDLDSSMAIEGVVITSGGFGGASGSGDGGSGVGLSTRSPPSDSAKGKDPVVEEEEPTEVPTKGVEFQPAAGSSGHRPISRNDFVEFVDKVVLGRLLRDNLAVVCRGLDCSRREIESHCIGSRGGLVER